MGNELLARQDYQNRYRTSGIIIFAMSVLVLLARISVYFISDLFGSLEESTADFVLDLIFSVTVQVLILFVMPLLVYRIMLKMSFKEVFSFSNFRKTKLVNIPLAFALGILGIIVTIGISFSWQIILYIIGYRQTASTTVLSSEFSPWMFIGSLILTAVLPGFCEEFTMRGGFLNGLRSAFPIVSVILTSALAFGLFHQYIGQLYYTAFFGALMAFVTIRTKSIFPAMIIHFTNNGLSVYLDFAEAYGWLGGGFFTGINDMIENGGFFLLVLIYLAVTAAFLLLLRILAKCNPKEVKLPVMLDGRIPSSDENTSRFSSIFTINKFKLDNINLQKIESYTVKKSPPLEADTTFAPRVIYGLNAVAEDRILFVNNRYYLLRANILYALRDKTPFSPKLSDNVFYIGAIVVSALSTLFTLIWGYFI